MHPMADPPRPKARSHKGCLHPHRGNGQANAAAALRCKRSRAAGPGQGYGLQAEHRSHCTPTEQVRPRPNERYSETYRQSARLQAAHLELSREFGEQVKAHLFHLCLWYGSVCMHACIRPIPRAGLKTPLSLSLSVRLPVCLSVFPCFAIRLAFSRTLTNGASRSRRTGTICQRTWVLRFVTPRGCVNGSGGLQTP